MKILKSLLFALLIGGALTSSGCYVDEVAVDAAPVVVYLGGVGYGYYYNNTWYAAPLSFRYYNGVRPNWGPYPYHFRGRPYYQQAPFYRGGGYRGGWRHR